ncbi:unnamed protein product, partial [Ectocarpus sp. 8 AP-2014]
SFRDLVVESGGWERVLGRRSAICSTSLAGFAFCKPFQVIILGAAINDSLSQPRVLPTAVLGAYLHGSVSSCVLAMYICTHASPPSSVSEAPAAGACDDYTITPLHHSTQTRPGGHARVTAYQQGTRCFSLAAGAT